MINRTITLITGSRDTGDSLSEQLTQYLEKHHELKLIVLDESYPDSVESDLVVFSSRSLEEESREKISRFKAGKFISGRRTISHQAIDSLVTIPPGTDILFINDDRVSTEESIEALKQIGFNQFNYRASYPPLLETGGIKRAITAGETHLVPEEVEKVYDLGSRVFDFPTLSAILSYLKIPMENIEAPSFRYLKKIVSTSAKVTSYSRRINKLNSQLLMLIEGSGEGLITYDTSGTILMANENFRTGLTPKTDSLVGSTLREIIPYPILLTFLMTSGNEENAEMTLGGKRIAVKKTFHENSSTYICSFRFIRDESKSSEKAWLSGFDSIYSASSIMKTIKEQAVKLAGTDLSLLIEGEQGTGKARLAKAVHSSSGQKDHPCGELHLNSMSREQMEAELNSFLTGDKKGTFILKEAGHLTIELQKRLLQYMAVPSERKRIISTWSGSLSREVEEGRFLPELYYKLKESYLLMPPLRERSDDIPLIVGKVIGEYKGGVVKISAPLLRYLKSCRWPGNVRELINTARTMAALSEGKLITMESLPAGMVSHIDKEQMSLNEKEMILLKAVERLNCRGQVAGREKLLPLCKEMGLILTEAQIRRHLKMLTTEGYTAKEPGRYGLTITEKGRENIK